MTTHTNEETLNKEQGISKDEETTALTEALWESHFWAATFPYFKSTLFISPQVLKKTGEEGNESSPSKSEDSSAVPSPNGSVEDSLNDSVESLVQIFDADGDLINEIGVQSSCIDVTVLELDQFLGAAKLEGGQKHVHVKVVSMAPCFHMCRTHTAKGAAVLGEPLVLNVDRSVFFPLRVGEERQNQLCVINQSGQASNVKCRLFMGARTPDFNFSVPGNGSRVFSVEAEFADQLEGVQGEKQCYLRLSTKSRGSLGVQLVERVGSMREIGMFSSVS